MIHLKKKRRIQMILVASVALVTSTAVIGYALRGGINLFRSPSQVLAAPPGPKEVFRIGGMVETGSLVEGKGTSITFVVTDCDKAVPVSYTGVRPDLFAEGRGVVATGSYRDGRFMATEILAKHDANYMPKEVSDTLKKKGMCALAQK